MTRAVIVQARFGSSRFPGKVLMPLGGRPALAAVLDRCARIPGIDVVVCAVAHDRASDPVAAVARECGAVVFRGSEHDVLGRYAAAAGAVGADVVMRVTSDCPLIDPMLAGEVLSVLDETGADYACNNLPPLWPHGLDCDAFHVEHLARAAAEAYLPFDREHVTTWLKRDPRLHRINVAGPGRGLERLRWTLDHPEDYAFFQLVWQALGNRVAVASTAEILALLARRPQIAAVNSACVDEARLADRSVLPDLEIESRLLEAA